MEPAVSTVLAEVLSQPTAWGDLGDWRFVPGFQANWKPVPQAGRVPHSRWNSWQPQAMASSNVPVRITRFSAYSRNGRRQSFARYPEILPVCRHWLCTAPGEKCILTSGA